MESISPQETIESALKTVQNAYYTHVSILTNEINRLSKELEEKTTKIKEIEVFSQQLLIENKRLHRQVEKLLEENYKTNSSNSIGISQKLMLDNHNVNAVQNLKNKNIIKRNLIINNRKGGNFNTLSIDPPVIKKISIETPKITMHSINQKDFFINSNRSNKLIWNSSQKSLGNVSTSQISTDFIKKAKVALEHDEYLQLIDIIKMSNEKVNISKQDTFKRITKLLKSKYYDLYSDFKDIFSYNY